MTDCDHDFVPYKIGASKFGGGFSANVPTAFVVNQVICVKCGEVIEFRENEEEVEVRKKD